MYKQIMKKYIFLIILFTFSAFYGKSENDVIVIDSSDTIPCFKLSEVAQRVDSVSLKIKGMGSAQNIFLSEDYIFLQGVSSVAQYTRSGKLLRILDCEDYTMDIAGDTTKKELYVFTGDQGRHDVRCFDMHTGRLKRKFALDSLEATSCVFFENALWMLRGAYLNRAVEYSLSKMDCQTGNIQNLGTFYKESYDKGAIFLSKGNFSIYQGRLFFALNTGNTVYEIRGDKMVPYLQWQIEPNEHYFPQYEAICNKAKVGRYLFVNYRLMFLKEGEGDEDEVASYWFVKDLESDRQFKKGCVSGAQKMISATADGLHSNRCIVYPTIFISQKRLTMGLPFILSK